jgi:single-stranded DNA-specific DHH superfamily exonuclease
VEALGARADLLSYFGGHARAAGFTVAVANLEPLLAHLRAYMASASLGGGRPVLDEVQVDCRLPLSRVGRETYRTIRALGPFGPGFPEPRFLARGARILRCFRAGPAQRHLRLVLRDGTGERVASWPNRGQYAPAIVRHLSSLPALDVIYAFDPFYVSSSADQEYVSVVALTPAR